jgi:hypothetical protein
LILPAIKDLVLFGVLPSWGPDGAAISCPKRTRDYRHHALDLAASFHERSNRLRLPTDSPLIVQQAVPTMTARPSISLKAAILRAELIAGYDVLGGCDKPSALRLVVAQVCDDVVEPLPANSILFVLSRKMGLA